MSSFNSPSPLHNSNFERLSVVPLRLRIEAKLENVLSKNKEKTPLSEWYIHPCPAIGSQSGSYIENQPDNIPYSFETTDMLWTKWFRFHGVNKEGKWFMVSWPIQGNTLNIKHLTVDNNLRWGLWVKVFTALEKYAKSLWAQSIYATFANLRTAHFFRNKNWFKQIRSKDIPNDLWMKLMVEPKWTMEKNISDDELKNHSQIISQIERWAKNEDEKLRLARFYLKSNGLEDKQMLMCKKLN